MNYPIIFKHLFLCTIARAIRYQKIDWYIVEIVVKSQVGNKIHIESIELDKLT